MQTFESNRPQIATIKYCKRFGTRSKYKDLVDARYLAVGSKNAPSKQRKKDSQMAEKLWKVYPIKK